MAGAATGATAEYEMSADAGATAGVVTSEYELQVGDCIVDPWADEIVVVPCSEEHLAEVVLVDETFYSQDSLAPDGTDERTDEASVAAIEEYTGQPIDGSPYWYYASAPSTESWADGDRLLVVYGTTWDYDSEQEIETTGSIGA